MLGDSPSPALPPDEIVFDAVKTYAPPAASTIAISRTTTRGTPKILRSKRMYASFVDVTTRCSTQRRRFSVIHSPSNGGIFSSDPGFAAPGMRGRGPTTTRGGAGSDRPGGWHDSGSGSRAFSKSAG